MGAEKWEGRAGVHRIEMFRLWKNRAHCQTRESVASWGNKHAYAGGKEKGFRERTHNSLARKRAGKECPGSWGKKKDAPNTSKEKWSKEKLKDERGQRFKK